MFGLPPLLCRRSRAPDRDRGLDRRGIVLIPMARSLVHRRVAGQGRGTLGKFLGKDFTVTASYGHVRDLDRKGLSVDRTKDYKPDYRIGARRKRRPSPELTRARQESRSRVPRRRTPTARARRSAGTCTSSLKKEAPNATFHRADVQRDHEDRRAARDREARQDLDRHRVDAQQARRIIDRLVGYEVSDAALEQGPARACAPAACRRWRCGSSSSARRERGAFVAIRVLLGRR